MLHGYIAHADHDQAVNDFQRWFHLHGALVTQQMAESGLFGKKLSFVGSCWIATHGDVLTRSYKGPSGRDLRSQPNSVGWRVPYLCSVGKVYPTWKPQFQEGLGLP